MRLYKLAKDSFISCPSPEELDACVSIESAQELLTNYYEGAFKTEFVSYLNAIKVYTEDIFSLS